MMPLILNPTNPMRPRSEEERILAGHGSPFTVIRTAGFSIPSTQLKISKVTYIDITDPTTNFYGTDPLIMKLTETESQHTWIIVDLPQPVRCKSSLILAGRMNTGCGVDGWDYTQGEGRLEFGGGIFPILDWGGRTVEDITWDTRGDLTLGSSMASPILSICVGAADTSMAALYGNIRAGYQGTGDTSPRHAFGGLYANAGSDLTLSGLVLAPGLTWDNIYYSGFYGPMYGTMEMVKPTAADDPIVDMALLYNAV